MIVMIAAVLTSAAVALAEAGAQAATASIGDVAFAFTNQQDYYDVTYKYPDAFELEIKEDDDRVRHILRYHVEGYDPAAVTLVVSRTNEYTPEERLADVAFIDQVTTEEINGAPWVIGTKTDTSNGSVLIYVCAAGEYTYTFSFSSDFPADFDYADFARVFAGEVSTH